jgi:adenine-specific DNA-methyltransferase
MDKVLYKTYYGRVKMIYIDPPYNTGKDFIYPEHYASALDTEGIQPELEQNDGNRGLLSRPD